MPQDMQDMMADQRNRDVAELRDSGTERPRSLTHDEIKAAEAAYQGEPFNPAWSAAAGKVYAGILFAMGHRRASEPADPEVSEKCIVGR